MNLTNGDPWLSEISQMEFNSTQKGLMTVEECNGEHNNASDSDCLRHAPTLTDSGKTKIWILSIMAFLSIIGNVATMLNIRKSQRSRSGHIYLLIYHLSIADLWVSIWCMIGEAVWHFTVEWKAGNIECKVFKFAQMFSLYLSTFIMALIGVDRFISVKYPLKSMSKGLCCRLIALCWIISFLLSSPQILVFHVMKGPFIEPFYQCVTHGSYTEAWQEQLYIIFSLVCMFVLPFFILVSTYLLTVCTLHRTEDILDHSAGSFRTLIDPKRIRKNIIRKAKMKSLRISLAIFSTFLVCWTPYYALMILNIFYNIDQIEEQVENNFKDEIFYFGMSNSLCNPVIYGIFHLWKPRRKELQRGNSSKKTLLTNLSFYRQRSGTMMNVIESSHNNEPGKPKLLINWKNGRNALEENTSM